GIGGEYGYSAQEHAIILDVIRDLRRRFQVDSDRVFLFGSEQGAAMAYDIGLSHPDLFAGVMPMGAWPRYFAQVYTANAQYLPFYVVDGDRNFALPPKGKNQNRQQLLDWTKNRYNTLYAEYKGRNSEFFAEELPYLFDWMSRKKRANPIPEYGTGGAFHTMRATDNRFYWLGTDSVLPRSINSIDNPKWFTVKSATLYGSVDRGSNHLQIKAYGVRNVNIWLGPNMIDLTKDAKISLNGGLPRPIRKDLIQPKLEVLLEDF